METVRAIVPIMPVIEKIIVEQSGADQRMQVDPMPQMQPVGEPYRQTCHTDGMGECGHRTMLVAVSLDSHMPMPDDFGAVLLHEALDLRSSEMHRFA